VNSFGQRPFILDDPAASLALETLGKFLLREGRATEDAPGIVNLRTRVRYAGREVVVNETVAGPLSMVMDAYDAADDFAAAVALADCVLHGEPVFILEERKGARPVGLRLAWVAGNALVASDVIHRVREGIAKEGKKHREIVVPLTKEVLLERASPYLASVSPATSVPR